MVIRLCQDDEHGELPNSDFPCNNSTTIADIKKHLSPLCKDVAGFLGEADIIIHSANDHKLFGAMTVVEAGLGDGDCSGECGVLRVCAV